MADIYSKEKRSIVMSRIKGKETSLEIKARKWLFSHGIRYRKNVRSVAGTPDIAIKRFKICVFVNGCFWHGHDQCSLFRMPKTNADFWMDKITRNKERDLRNIETLESQGWEVITLWECQIKWNFEEVMSFVHKRITERRDLL